MATVVEGKVTVIHPVLTEEERAKRIEYTKKCVLDFWIAYQRNLKEKEDKQNDNQPNRAAAASRVPRGRGGHDDCGD